MSEVLIDLSELAAEPARTGIQRVEREILRRWPGPASLEPVVFDAGAGGFVRFAERTAKVAVGGKIVFNPELFYDPRRVEFYRALCRDGAKVSWLLYDFLPWLAPGFFHAGAARVGMDFLRALRDVRRVAFISEETRADYRAAVMRDRARDGPVFALGGDGLGLARQAFDPARRSFVSLGTIEPRRNVGAILEGFRTLWAEGVEAKLVLIGKLIGTGGRERAMLASLAGAPQLSFIEEADEETVREALSRARALVSASRAEGFGLPPFEALSAGIPVIAPEDMPSVRLLAPLGQIRLGRVDAGAIAEAVRALLDDEVAARLWAEAARLAVPGWEDFARALADWVQEG
jgi:glycosyltransferase involved in cell wall biosynthesis